MATTTASQDAQSRLAQLTVQLRNLAQSMKLAKDTNQTAALALFREQYRGLSAEAAELRQIVNQEGAPSTFLVTLDRFSDEAIAVGKELGEDTSAFAKGIAASFKWLPLILGAAAVIAVVLAVSYASKKA